MYVRASMECSICGDRWEAVYPASLYDETDLGEVYLECPSCGHENLAPTKRDVFASRDEDSQF